MEWTLTTWREVVVAQYTGRQAAINPLQLALHWAVARPGDGRFRTLGRVRSGGSARLGDAGRYGCSVRGYEMYESACLECGDGVEERRHGRENRRVLVSKQAREATSLGPLPFRSSPTRWAVSVSARETSPTLSLHLRNFKSLNIVHLEDPASGGNDRILEMGQSSQQSGRAVHHSKAPWIISGQWWGSVGVGAGCGEIPRGQDVVQYSSELAASSSVHCSPLHAW